MKIQIVILAIVLSIYVVTIFSKLLLVKNKYIVLNPVVSYPSITPKPSPTPTPTITITPTPTPTKIPTPTPIPNIITSTQLEELFTRFSNEYSVDKELLKRIAKCESNFNPNAVNKIYAGLFQFSDQLWISTRNLMNLDSDINLRLNAVESIRTAAFMVSQNKLGIWPNCNK